MGEEYTAAGDEGRRSGELEGKNITVKVSCK